ncbi:uncharacterized protein PAC_07882 [Phialocephala subalpina]|uniref:Uncharacterized protein n=1 Tax=Phialocephala subalpina TaxID=576137 RepID=A0A1L7WZ03_9HELO|nr:uncharacterized protein PAC_07882 [Phialocephala subalpina]
MGSSSSMASTTPPHRDQTIPGLEHNLNLSPVQDPELAIVAANEIANQNSYEPSSLETGIQSELSLAQSMATDQILRDGPAYDNVLRAALSFPTTDRNKYFKDYSCFDVEGRIKPPWKFVDVLVSRIKQERNKIKLQHAKEREATVISDAKTPPRQQDSPRPRPSNTQKASRQPAAIQSTRAVDQRMDCQLNSDFGDGRPKRRCSSCARHSASTPSKASKKYGTQPNKRLRTSVNTKGDYTREYTSQPTNGAPVSEDQRPSRHKRSAGPDPPSPTPTYSNHDEGLSLPGPKTAQPKKRASQPKLKVIVSQSNPTSAVSPSHGTEAGIGSGTRRSKSLTRAGSMIPLATQYHVDTLRGCQVCNMPECICVLAQRPSQTITCSEHACSTHLFNASSLQRMYGMQLLENAQEQISKTGSWSCPECTQKRSARLQQSPVSAGAYTVSSPLHGDSFLSQDEIRRPLNELSGKISQYIKMAFTQPSPYPLVPFTEIPCIRHESSADPLVPVLRRLLNLGDGVSIRVRIEGLHMGPEESAIWIKGVLMLLVCDFIFESGSPFEDAPELTDSLSHLIESNLLEMIIQDSRIRAMNKKPENAPRFSQRRKLLHDDFVKQLNGTMHSLVGCNDETQRFHSEIARIAIDLNEKIFAYRAQGIHEPIVAKRGDLFDPEYHELDSPEMEGAAFNQRDLKGKPILLTAIVGVKFKARGQERWEVCSPAKVRLWRNAVSTNESVAAPKAILPPRKGKS